jgi:anti-anti-sigma factor
MTEVGTSRRYRPNPTGICQPERWGPAYARATLTFETIIVTVTGEIDAHNAPQLARYIERHSALVSRLFVDLREVTFFATAGLAALRRVEHQVNLREADWRLLPSPAVRKLLRICGADDLPQIEALEPVRRPASTFRVAPATT